MTNGAIEFQGHLSSSSLINIIFQKSLPFFKRIKITIRAILEWNYYPLGYAVKVIHRLNVGLLDGENKQHFPT